MSLRFFTDHCVPNSVGAALSAHSYDVVRLRDHIPTNSPDPQVIAAAQQLNAILLSLNANFADIVAYPPATYKGIVCLQVRNRPETLPLIVTD